MLRLAPHPTTAPDALIDLLLLSCNGLSLLERYRLSVVEGRMRLLLLRCRSASATSALASPSGTTSARSTTILFPRPPPWRGRRRTVAAMRYAIPCSLLCLLLLTRPQPRFPLRTTHLLLLLMVSSRSRSRPGRRDERRSLSRRPSPKHLMLRLLPASCRRPIPALVLTVTGTERRRRRWRLSRRGGIRAGGAGNARHGRTLRPSCRRSRSSATSSREGRAAAGPDDARAVGVRRSGRASCRRFSSLSWWVIRTASASACVAVASVVSPPQYFGMEDTAATAPSQTCHVLLPIASSVTASIFAGLTISSTSLFSHGLVLLAAAAITGTSTTRCAC